MGFASKEDEEKAYRTNEDIVGRSLRRGTDKALNALTLGLWGAVTGSADSDGEGDIDIDPFTHLAKDAAREAPKAYRRSKEKK